MDKDDKTIAIELTELFVDGIMTFGGDEMVVQ